MEKNRKKRKSKVFVEKIRSKYRLVILNTETFEERISLLLSPLNVFVWGGVSVITLITLVTLIISYTPLREYIPGYSDVKTKENAMYAAFKVDSLEQALISQKKYINNIQAIIEGKPIERFANRDSTIDATLEKDEVDVQKSDSLLKKIIETEDSYNIDNSNIAEVLNNIYMFPPLRGVISSAFDVKTKHYGIDIVANKDEAIKSVLDGTVIFSEWTSETGFVIQVQHSFELISIYKHNSRLLKEAGETVKAGDAIAIIGSTGEFSTGPHLHLELWYKGKPVDPENFINF